MVSEAVISPYLWPQFVSLQSHYRFEENVSQNWKEFEEQLTWFLEETESSNKSDMVKISIMLSHARKEAIEVHKTLQWNAEGHNQRFD